MDSYTKLSMPAAGSATTTTTTATTTTVAPAAYSSNHTPPDTGYAMHHSHQNPHHQHHQVQLGGGSNSSVANSAEHEHYERHHHHQHHHQPQIHMNSASANFFCDSSQQQQFQNFYETTNNGFMNAYNNFYPAEGDSSYTNMYGKVYYQSSNKENKSDEKDLESKSEPMVDSLHDMKPVTGELKLATHKELYHTMITNNKYSKKIKLVKNGDVGEVIEDESTSRKEDMEDKSVKQVGKRPREECAMSPLNAQILADKNNLIRTNVKIANEENSEDEDDDDEDEDDDDLNNNHASFDDSDEEANENTENNYCNFF